MGRGQGKNDFGTGAAAKEHKKNTKKVLTPPHITQIQQPTLFITKLSTTYFKIPY
jgi:hypothetical protein